MPRTNKIPVVVVYKKSKRKTAKSYLEVFEDILVDDLINANKRKPLLPDKYEIVEIGLGKSFVKTYKEKYKI